MLLPTETTLLIIQTKTNWFCFFCSKQKSGDFFTAMCCTPLPFPPPPPPWGKVLFRPAGGEGRRAKRRNIWHQGEEGLPASSPPRERGPFYIQLAENRASNVCCSIVQKTDQLSSHFARSSFQGLLPFFVFPYFCTQTQAFTTNRKKQQLPHKLVEKTNRISSLRAFFKSNFSHDTKQLYSFYTR